MASAEVDEAGGGSAVAGTVAGGQSQIADFQRRPRISHSGIADKFVLGRCCITTTKFDFVCNHLRNTLLELESNRVLRNEPINHDSYSHLETLQMALESGDLIDLGASGVASNVIDGETITNALLDGSLKPHPAGLSIRGARIVGNLNLDNATVGFPIRICHSEFENQPSFNSARLASLNLVGSTFPGINLNSAVMTGNVDLTHVKSTDAIRAGQIKVSGTILLNDASISAAAYPILDDGAPGWGAGRAVNFAGADIAGILNLHRAKITGGTSLYRAKIGDLICELAALNNPGFVALNMNLVTVAGNANFKASIIAGAILGHNSAVNGNLILRKAEVRNGANEAFVLVGATVRGAALFEDLKVDGQLNGFSAKFGRISLHNATLNNKQKVALNLEGVETAGNVHLRGVEVDGCVSFHSARIGGMLDLSNAELRNQNAVALNLGAAEVDNQLLMDYLRVEGAVAAQSIRVGEAFRLMQARLISNHGPALNLSHSNISGPACLVDIEAAGQVIAHAARFGGTFDLSGTQVSVEDNGTALDLSGASIFGLLIKDVELGSATLNLARANIEHLELADTNTPRLSQALGWKLGTVHGPTFANGQSASRWLNSLSGHHGVGPGFSAEPWKELAHSFSRMGKQEDARHLLLVAARMTTKAKPGKSRIWRAPYGWLVGYGYLPWLVIPWLGVVWAASFALASMNAEDFAPTDLRAMTVTDPNAASGADVIPVSGASTDLPPGYPKFSPGLIALDTSIPTIGAVQTSAWRVKDNQALTGTFAILKLSSWALMALLLAAITGILRKD